MISAAFFEVGSNRPLGTLPMACPPDRGDYVVLPDQGDRQWQVDARLFRPVGGPLAWRREEVELWVSLVG